MEHKSALILVGILMGLALLAGAVIATLMFPGQMQPNVQITTDNITSKNQSPQTTQVSTSVSKNSSGKSDGTNKPNTYTCSVCGGDGWISCSACGGSGVVENETACPVCNGAGGHPCENCGGDGIVGN